MRNLLVLIILAAAAYFGWKAWQEQPEWLVRLLPKQTPPAETEPTPEPDTTVAAGATPTPAPPPTPVPRKFVSRINVPAAALGSDPAKLAPGSFLVTERASVETKDGVVAIIPGDQVRLIERHNNGTLTVTNGQQDFVVKETQVTQDIAKAQEAERLDFEKRFGKIQ